MRSNQQRLLTHGNRERKTCWLLSLASCLFWGGYLLIPHPIPAAARPLPTPPDVLPGLPTSPNTPPAFPQDTLPSISPNPSGRREIEFQAPPPITPSRRTPSRSRDENSPPVRRNSRLFGVFINGDSPLLLAQVRKIEPEAFVRYGGGVIQAGVFADEFKAQQRVRDLEEWGIRAKISAYSEENFDADAENFDSRPVTRRDEVEEVTYFVVIPGSQEYLPDIAAHMIRLGFPKDEVFQREVPRGPHVAVGPFENQSQAERWSRFLRSNGMDARVVYFGQ
ncbi:hypothetical protein H6F78_17465 [Coleofasciculus sp. FACHB-64]|uniref:hypothetical protein n=1 Tax=Cyanophyceae TaxID=3028117 RepID=UPI00168204F6|nr:MULTISPECIES: hypothetical protein [unclassified Coleofasciculus]MBD1837478.1 hypothetical protein [Coleofasciculus sp. FACHB-501]MBD2047361.1 hypothetical protein [Coleofasciculus sp. FACHB-64]